MGKVNKWDQIKANAEKEAPKVDIKSDLDFDPIDTEEELRKIEKMTHDANDTQREMEVLRNTSVGAPVRLPAQISGQENNLGADDTSFEIDAPKPNTPNP
ncbi:hypothetical protein FOLKNPGA_01368 [Legionella sp. PC1000]|uniref:hypothetical protein n=1 Tax=Legionella sp. PC1000 TaxID=2746060 RepID=UPI00186315BB|nr:hypothetical protein [Legionella sp. PC1000]QLZ68589.1 hypothetical protein FOLKNPGA_01368 [Legionella sp. PC1000]